MAFVPHSLNFSRYPTTTSAPFKISFGSARPTPGPLGTAIAPSPYWVINVSLCSYGGAQQQSNFNVSFPVFQSLCF